jgi:uncharacterized protein (DUF1786 family)
MDIGAGTLDVLLYDSKKKLENCVKMVLPSPAKVYAKRVSDETVARNDLFIRGDTIGGGALSKALREHMEKGLKVVMTGDAAYSIRNDPEKVEELGIKIQSDDEPPENFSGSEILLQEVSLDKFNEFLKEYDETLEDVDVVAIAVKDHGASPRGMSDRKFRMQQIHEALLEDSRIENLSYTEDDLPPIYLRMKSDLQAAKRHLPQAKVLVMDTSPAALLGCLEDTRIKGLDPILAVNLGNGHTMASIVSKGRIIGVFEHHTSMLNLEKMEKMLTDFTKGDLTDEEIFNDGGHGLVYLEKPSKHTVVECIAVTGPNRSLMHESELNIQYAAPGGDMMMTGPIGLIEAVKRKMSL